MVYWPTVIRAVDFIEGALGTILNCIVIYLLWRRTYSSNLMACRVSITITSLQGVLSSLITMVFMNLAHLFYNKSIIVVVYGYLATLNENFCHFLICISCVLGFFIWELVPGACLLQYLTLSRPHLSVARRIVLAYGPTLAMSAWTLPCISVFHSSMDFYKIVNDVHRPTADDTVLAMGALLQATEAHPLSMVRAAIMFIIPTLAISYGVFAICVIKSRQMLTKRSIKLSKKTISMHRKFLIMMTGQNLLPLIVVSFPMSGLLTVAFTGGMSMGLMTLPLAFTLFALPIVQGAVALLFVVRLNQSPVADRSKISSITRFQTFNLNTVQFRGEIHQFLQ